MVYISSGWKYYSTMKMMKNYLLSLGAILILSGCSTTFRPWSLSEIEEGMDREQVIQILGEPDYAVMQDGAEHLHYSYQEDYSPSNLPFDSSIETQIQAMNVERSMRVLEYDVILIDGKVLNYKDVTN